MVSVVGWIVLGTDHQQLPLQHLGLVLCFLCLESWWSDSGLLIRGCYELISGFSDAWSVPEAQLQEKGHAVQGQWRILYHSNSPLIPLSQPT